MTLPHLNGAQVELECFGFQGSIPSTQKPDCLFVALFIRKTKAQFQFLIPHYFLFRLKHSGSCPLLVTAQRATRLLPATLAQRQVVASNCLVCADNLPPGVHVFALWEKAGVSGGSDGPRENKLLQTPCRKAIARQLNCQPFQLSQAKTLWDLCNCISYQVSLPPPYSFYF